MLPYRNTSISNIISLCGFYINIKKVHIMLYYETLRSIDIFIWLIFCDQATFNIWEFVRNASFGINPYLQFNLCTSWKVENLCKLKCISPIFRKRNYFPNSRESGLFFIYTDGEISVKNVVEKPSKSSGLCFKGKMNFEFIPSSKRNFNGFTRG